MHGSFDQIDDWVHVAIVYTGCVDSDDRAEIRHYINGEKLPVIMPETVSDVDTDHESELAKPLRFGTSLHAETLGKSLDGDLDEMYLFRGVLNAAQIKGLMENNRVDFSSK